jgi:O-antigen/teichoic acid export membrane protein
MGNQKSLLIWMSRVKMAYHQEDQAKVRKGVFLTVLGKFAELSQGVYLFLARYLFGGEQFGLFIIGFNIMELLSRFLTGGFGDAATFFSAKHLEQKERGEGALYRSLFTVLLMPLLLSIFLATILFFLIDPIYAKFWSQHNEQLKTMIQGYVIVLPLMVLVKVPLQAIKGHMEMGWAVAIENTALPLFHLLLSLLFFVLDFSGQGLVWASVLSYGLLVPLSWYGFFRYYSLTKLLRHWGFSRECLAFSWPQSFNMMMNYGLVKVDSIMLSAFLSADSVGIYTLVAELMRSIRSAKTTFSGVYAPLVAKYKEQNNRLGIEHALWSISRSTALLSIPLLVIIQIFFNDVIAGPGSIWEFSIAIPWLLALGPMMSCFFGLAGNTLLMTGHTRLLLSNSLLLMGVNVLLNYLLIPQWGMLGAAWATALSGLGISITQVLQLRYFENIHFHYGKHLQVVLYALPFVLLALFLQSDFFVLSIKGVLPLFAAKTAVTSVVLLMVLWLAWKLKWFSGIKKSGM